MSDARRIKRKEMKMRDLFFDIAFDFENEILKCEYDDYMDVFRVYLNKWVDICLRNEYKGIYLNAFVLRFAPADKDLKYLN